jgi:flagellar hook assembly protein FlgD
MREEAGIKSLVWDGTDDDGRKVAKGGYICVVKIYSGSAQVLVTRKIGVLH